MTGPVMVLPHRVLKWVELSQEGGQERLPPLVQTPLSFS